MPHLYCGRCGLEIKIQTACLRIDNCPRCEARSATVTPMVLTAGGVGAAVGWGARAPDHPADVREPGEPFTPAQRS
jgi:hypothetical protein